MQETFEMTMLSVQLLRSPLHGLECLANPKIAGGHCHRQEDREPSSRHTRDPHVMDTSAQWPSDAVALEGHHRRVPQPWTYGCRALRLTSERSGELEV